MATTRPVFVHLLPSLVDAARLTGAIVVVIDVLRASTTFIHALAAGCKRIIPAVTIDDARRLASQIPQGERVLGGERDGLPIDGFDLGNSPEDYTAAVCAGRVAVCTTTNGTRAVVHAATAARTLIGAYVNFSAICQELLPSDLPIHLLCAGANGEPALEDTLFAGAVVEFLSERFSMTLNDSARMAWDTHEHHGHVLISALEISAGGRALLELGMDQDLRAAASVDRFGLVPEVSADDRSIVVTRMALEDRHFRGETGLW